MEIFFTPGVAEAGTVIFPDIVPLPLIVKVLVAEVPPIVALVIFSEAAHPFPVTVIEAPVIPEVGLKLAAGVILNALLKVLAPETAPVMTMFLKPPTCEGTVMVPDKVRLLLTVRVLVAATPPRVALLICSFAAHPYPETVITVPIGPLTGLKLAVLLLMVKDKDWLTALP